jgi:hypothetical protein
MKADGGRKARFAHVEFNVKNHGGRNPRFAPVKNNVKNDGGRNPAICPRDQAPRPLPGKIPPQALKSETKLKPKHEI